MGRRRRRVRADTEARIPAPATPSERGRVHLVLAALVIPAPDFSEAHSRFVRSNVERSLWAARDVPVGEIRSLRPLWAMRALPATLLGSRSIQVDRDRSLWDTALAAGFQVLIESPDGAALGHVGQHWRPLGGERPDFDGLDGFAAFARPGFCRVVVTIEARPHEDGVILATETRVAATDEEARRRFGRYWLVVRPFSGLIRRGWLQAARRRAAIG